MNECVILEANDRVYDQNFKCRMTTAVRVLDLILIKQNGGRFKTL